MKEVEIFSLTENVVSESVYYETSEISNYFHL